MSGWDYHGSLIAGIALSTTAVAVVYAVRGLGYGVLEMVNGLGNLFSSIIVGTLWRPELWWSRLHQRLGLGGIVVEFDRA